MTRPADCFNDRKRAFYKRTSPADCLISSKFLGNKGMASNSPVHCFVHGCLKLNTEISFIAIHCLPLLGQIDVAVVN